MQAWEAFVHGASSSPAELMRTVLRDSVVRQDCSMLEKKDGKQRVVLPQELHRRGHTPGCKGWLYGMRKAAVGWDDTYVSWFLWSTIG